MIERVSSFQTKMARGFPEAFLIFGARKKDGAQAEALSFPAKKSRVVFAVIAPRVFGGEALRKNTSGFRRERTRACGLSRRATSQRANQSLQRNASTRSVSNFESPARRG